MEDAYLDHGLDPTSSPEVSVVMPCLNEARTLETCILKAQRCLESLQVRGEVIVADNGSTDGSRELAARLGARVIAVAERGYGCALRAGIAAARGRYVIMGDSDDSYDFSALGPFIEKLREGHDLVMGNRFRGGIKPGAMPLLHRYFGNPVLSWLARLFFRVECGDVYCGLRGFSKAAIERLVVQSPGMEFALEMVVKATLNGLRVAEVPTTLSPDGRDRAPHLKTWRDGRRSLKFYLLCCPQWLFFYPGLFMIALGAIMGLWITAEAVHIGQVRLDIHMLVYCGVSVLIGAMALSFAALAWMLAYRYGLLPASSPWWRFLRAIRFEHGIIAGGVLGLAGLLGSVDAVLEWMHAGFGDLDPFREMRIVIPSAVALVLGFQLIMTSVYLSFLKAQYLNAPSAAVPPASVELKPARPAYEENELAPTAPESREAPLVE